MVLRLPVALRFSSTISAFAAPLSLVLPEHCALARDCFIQNNVDHDNSAAVKDYHCGNMTYDGH